MTPDGLASRLGTVVIMLIQPGCRVEDGRRNMNRTQSSRANKRPMGLDALLENHLAICQSSTYTPFLTHGSKLSGFSP